VISPLIFGIALHGMEEAAGAAYRWNPYREAESAVPGTPVLVRYADDLVALCDSRERAEEAKARRKDRWVFGNRETGAYLPRFGWTKIVRHDLVKGRASPDDPALARYWAARRRKEQPPPLSADRLRLLRKQQGRCPLCGNLLLHADREPRSPEDEPRSPEEWEQWATAIGKAIVRHAITAPGSPADRAEKRLIHEHCRKRHHRQRQDGTTGEPASPPGLA
jgi:RNA-directed DNA polymerase